MSDVLINGEPQQSIPFNDRGLAYGDGLFETIKYQQGKLYYWQQHYQRLVNGCNALNIHVPVEQNLLDDIARLEKPEQTVIKIIITRGVSGRGYMYENNQAQNNQTENRIVSVHTWPEIVNPYKTGIKTRVCQHPLSINPVLAGIKHLNRLDQVMARNEWHNTEIQEGLMLNLDGDVIEGTSTNLFMIKNNIMYTSPVENCAVDGVMRQQAIQSANKLGIMLKQQLFKIDELSAADEVFVCNTIWGICPVLSCDDWQYDATYPLTISIQQHVESRSENYAHAL